MKAQKRSPAVILIVISMLVIIMACSNPYQGEWKPVEGTFLSKFAKDVRPDNVLPEYPRPQMVRDDWMNLNGLWEHAIRPRAQEPDSFDGKILVPFPVEAALSGVGKTVGAENTLWYRRTFQIPADWKGRTIFLRFGAVDWESAVWVNGRKLGSHRGGYDAFSFDITDVIKEDGPQEIILSTW
ncbi:sugar-binding domain-containing protein, partial [bacterium]